MATEIFPENSNYFFLFIHNNFIREVPNDFLFHLIDMQITD